MNSLNSILVGEDLHPLRTTITESNLFPQIKVLSALNDCDEALKSLSITRPDFVFLDISLLIGTSCEAMVRALKTSVSTSVIFIVPESVYLISYFEQLAVDFIVRPFDAFRLTASMKKVMARYEMRKALGIKRQNIEDIVTQLLNLGGVQTSVAPPKQQPNKLCISDSGSKIFIPTSEINWIDAAGDYMCINTQTETFVIRSTLKALLEKLDDDSFVRIHRSTIINIHKVKKVSHQSKGDYDMLLRCGKQLKVSRNYNNCIHMLL